MKSTMTFGVLAFLLVIGLCAPAYALGVDIPKPKKEKKKDEKKEDKETKKETSKKQDTDNADAKKQDAEIAPVEADAPVAPAAAFAMQDIKLPKSAWDKMGAANKVGDWVEYEMPATPNMSMRTEITEVGDHYYVAAQRTSFNGQGQDMKIKYVFSEADAVVGKVEETKNKFEQKEFADKVAVATKGDVAATRHESYLDGKLIGKSWISTDVPCGGMVKSEGADGKVVMLLKGFGRK